MNAHAALLHDTSTIQMTTGSHAMYIEDVFSVEELLALWSKFEAGEY